VPEWLCWQAR